MSGSIPEGSLIRLGECGEELGIAEGIETALSASVLYDIPVWSAINATMLEKAAIPRKVKRLVIFGDRDASFTGQHAAYALAKRVSTKSQRLYGSPIDITVELPEVLGQDWNDVLAKG